MNPSRTLVTGAICGVRVEEIEDPVMQGSAEGLKNMPAQGPYIGSIPVIPTRAHAASRCRSFE
jgi:hypothetical protein